MNNKNGAFCIAVTGLLLSACSTAVVNPNTLATQWGDRLRAYQIHPVFPPREDLQVGDIYLVCDLKQGAERDPARTGPGPQSIWVARLDLRETIKGNYRSSVRLPALTPQAGTGALTDPNSIGAMPSNTALVNGNSDLTALRNVSLPEFFSTSITSVQASALVPAGVVLAGLGLSSDDIASISLNIPAAGSYGIPWRQGQDAIYKEIQTHLGDDFWPWSDSLKRYYAPGCATNEFPSMIAITEIYAAYAISVNFSFERGAAARMAAKLDTPANTTRSATLQALAKAVADVQTAQAQKPEGGAGGAGSSSGTSGGGTGNGGTGSGGASSGGKSSGGTSNGGTENGGTGGASGGSGDASQQNQLNALLTLLTEQATGFEKQQFAGVSAQVISGSNSGIRVERIFSNPVVIGFKGLALSQSGAKASKHKSPTDGGRSPIPNHPEQPDIASERLPNSTEDSPIIRKPQEFDDPVGIVPVPSSASGK